MNAPPIKRSRLVKQESKRLARQTMIIIFSTLLFIIGFISFGIPSLMKLAVTIGNSKTTSKFAAQEDKIPPLPPQLNPLPEATSETTINIEGFGESGVTVSLFQNGTKEADTTVDNQGNFSFLNTSLETDSNVFYVLATDIAGNQSQPSVTQTVISDTEPPTLNIDSPNDGDKFYGELKQIINLIGTTDVKAQLTVNDRQLVVTGDGSFTSQYALQDGDNKLLFKAIDRAGNETTKEITVNFSK